MQEASKVGQPNRSQGAVEAGFSVNHQKNHKKVASMGSIEDIETLMSLGLTGRQARVYLALLKIGDNKANAVAKLSLVNRQEIYRILDSLQEIGLVQRKVTAPTTFTPTPVDEALKMLLEKKANELKITRQKTRGVIKKFGMLAPNSTTRANECCLGVISENDRGKKYESALENVQESIECVTTWNRFRQLVLFESQIEKILKNAINIRFILEKPPQTLFPNWAANAAFKKPSRLKLKTLPNQPSAAVTIFDNTTVCVALDTTADLKKGPHLWSNNPSIVSLAKAFFNNTWAQAKNLETAKQF
ncbi:MAG: hypothetical protein NWF04_09980 [Candidatus Bathyarchaeota archaeon]|nr:hypothetical protein [Candidatus Bathyarchaeota archaeon]